MREIRSFDHRAEAFVLGLGTNGLGVVRSLGEVGIRVTGLDWVRGAPGFRSRYCRAVPCPSPVDEPERLLELLLAEGGRLHRPAVLLPTGDAFVLFISRFRAELADRFLFALPEPGVMEAIVNKRLQYEMAERAGVSCPPTFYPESIEDVVRIKDMVEYPALLKPYFSHLWQPIFHNKAIQVNDPADLERRFAEVAPSGQPAMVQSLIRGPTANLCKVYAYLDGTGRPLAVFTARRLRQFPIDFGTTSSEESAHVDGARKLGLRFFQAIQFRGIGEVETKQDERDGQFRLVELNPRLWDQNRLAVRCGINFPLVAYLDLTGQHPEPRSEFPTGVRWIDAVNDFQAFWVHHHRGELGPVGWMRSVLGARSFAHFDWRDPLPFLAANDYGLKYARLPLYLLRYRRGRHSLLD